MTAADRFPAPSSRPLDDPARPWWVRAWSQTWRMALALAIGVSAEVMVFGFLLSFHPSAIEDDARAGLVLLASIPLGLIAVAAIPLRRRFPVTVGVVVGICGGLSLLAVGAAALTLASVATRRRAGEMVAVISAWMLAGSIAEWTGWTITGSVAPLGEILAGLALLLVFAALISVLGMYVGGRRDLMAALRERARLIEEEEALRLAGARDQERQRIAREMHDVLGHRLSLVALHAGALQHNSGLDAEQSGRAAAVIRENARAALDDLGDVLGVLREDGAGDARERPQPTLGDLPALVAEARADGSSVDLDVAERTRPHLAAVADPVGRHAYRIVQECLTNARRHAPGQPVRITVDGLPGERLTVSVRNPWEGGASGPARTGHGLLGIEERVRAVGGTVAVSRGDGEHAVEVDLPWRE